MGEVVQVVLVGVGFLFKAYVMIGLEVVAVFGIEEEPFQRIPHEERNVEQFALLGGMNALMVQLYGIQWRSREDEAKQANRIERLAYRKFLD